MGIVEFTEEQLMIKSVARDFAENEIKSIAAHLDRRSEFPVEILQNMSELGFMGIYVPEQYGGGGMDVLSYILALEEISKACASTGTIMSVNNSLVCDPLLNFGSIEQKEEYLIPLAKGEKLGCFALSEPSAGSDVSSIRTQAKRDGDRYIITGTKKWITNGPEADVIILFAKVSLPGGNDGITAFIVDKETPGLTVGKLDHKLGIKASSTSQLVFDECHVPIENRLGDEGDGFTIAMKTLDGGRIGIAALAVGIAQAAFEESLKYAKEREAFKQPISNFQAIQFMLADMALKIEASRLLVMKAAMMKDKKMKYSKSSSMAKLFASETAMWVTTKAIQIHGCYGYTTEYSVERHFRDAKVTEIYEGTSEIQRVLIARSLLSEN